MKRILFIALCTLVLSAPASGYTLDDLRSPDQSVRMKAAQEMGNNRIKAAVPALIELLKDESAKVRIASAVSLGYLKDPGVVDPLVSVLQNDEELAVRLMAAQSLGKFNGDKAVAALRGATKDADPQLRLVACVSLGKVGGAGEIKTLMNRIDLDGDVQVKKVALSAVTGILRRNAGSESLQAGLATVLTKAANDADTSVRDLAAEALAVLQEKQGH